MIAIIDYDIGNLAAVANMLNRLGETCEITANPARVEQANRIILPGNGSFECAQRRLSNVFKRGVIAKDSGQKCMSVRLSAACR